MREKVSLGRLARFLVGPLMPCRKKRHMGKVLDLGKCETFFS